VTHYAVSNAYCGHKAASPVGCQIRYEQKVEAHNCSHLRWCNT